MRHETVTTDRVFLFPVCRSAHTVRAEPSGFKTVNRPGVALTWARTSTRRSTSSPAESRRPSRCGRNPPGPDDRVVFEHARRPRDTRTPSNGRNPLHLIGLVPGVVGHSAEATSSGGTATHYINGDRGRGITTTQDGIDISDPVIPRGELTTPRQPGGPAGVPRHHQQREGRCGRSAAGGAGDPQRNQQAERRALRIRPNTRLDSNSYFNKLQGLPKEQLERNQFGAALGGPIRRDRAFFFVNYDGMRRTQEPARPSRSDGVAAQWRVPVRHAGVRRETAARNRPSCVDANGAPLVPVSSYSFVANDPRQLGLDPVMQQETLALLPLPNDFVGDGLNTARYRWNSPSESPLDGITGRVDYTLSKTQTLFGRYSTPGATI